MNFKMPCEIEYWYVIPAIRKVLSQELKELGLKQKEIAKKLSITEAAVSQYLKEKRAVGIHFNKEILIEIKKIAQKIKQSNTNQEQIRYIQTILQTIKKQGHLCKIHRTYDKNISSECDICLKE